MYTGELVYMVHPLSEIVFFLDDSGHPLHESIYIVNLTFCLDYMDIHIVKCTIKLTT